MLNLVLFAVASAYYVHCNLESMAKKVIQAAKAVPALAALPALAKGEAILQNEILAKPLYRSFAVCGVSLCTYPLVVTGNALLQSAMYMISLLACVYLSLRQSTTSLSYVQQMLLNVQAFLQQHAPLAFAQLDFGKLSLADSDAYAQEDAATEQPPVPEGVDTPPKECAEEGDECKGAEQSTAASTDMFYSDLGYTGSLD